MNPFQDYLQPLIGTDQFNVIPLAGDASSRRYYRVIANKKSWVLMEWEPFENAENFPFVSVQNYFHQNQIRVPEIFDCNKEKGLFLLEDLGDLTLERRFWEFQNQENVLPFYQRTLDELIKIHSLIFEDTGKRWCTAYQMEFSVEKLLWELNYGKKHLFAGLLKLDLTGREEQLEKEFTELCTLLYRSPQVICHRDFHSRNVMLPYDQLVIIDFQDARLGPPVYDLVSLFYDSYVQLDQESIDNLMSYYVDNFPHFNKLKMNHSQWMELYDLQSIQRCFKACGSFASFKMTRDDNRYLHYISPTLQRVLSKLSRYTQFPTLKTLIEESRESWEVV